MKYLIISDIHGSIKSLEIVLKHYQEMHCDQLLLLGDLLNYGPRNGLPEGLDPQAVAQRLNAMSDQVMAVRGNCDSEVDQMLLDFPILSDYMLLCDNGKKLFLTHGHLYNEQQMPKGHFDAVVYGHTHLWKLERQGDTVICNTGSPTFPKGGNVGTFGVMEEGEMRILDLEGKEIKRMKL